jgi:hypothetical protein
MPREDLKELVRADKEERVKRCGERINQVLQEERCTFEVAITITAHGNFPQIKIVAGE